MRVRITYECWVDVPASDNLNAIYDAAVSMALQLSAESMELVDIAFEDTDGDLVDLD